MRLWDRCCRQCPWAGEETGLEITITCSSVQQTVRFYFPLTLKFIFLASVDIASLSSQISFTVFVPWQILHRFCPSPFEEGSGGGAAWGRWKKEVGKGGCSVGCSMPSVFSHSCLLPVKPSPRRYTSLLFPQGGVFPSSVAFSPSKPMCMHSRWNVGSVTSPAVSPGHALESNKLPGSWAIREATELFLLMPIWSLLV